MLPVPSRRCRSAVLIVAGSIHARPDSIEQVLALSLAHVRRSRTEPGYLAHSVHRDCEDALRLVFIEHWADADALRAHFRVPASGAFVQELSALASGVNCPRWRSTKRAPCPCEGGSPAGVTAPASGPPARPRLEFSPSLAEQRRQRLSHQVGGAVAATVAPTAAE